MHASDPTFRVMHMLRLRGVCPKETLIAVTGLQAEEVEPILWPLEDEGLVEQRTGRPDGWTLTGEGRVRHGALLATDRDAGDLPSVLNPSYTRFLEVDQPFIELCSDWQIRTDDREPNDHTDAAYDDAILQRLGRIHQVGGPAAEEAGAAVERFASYAPRLAHAFGRVRDGDTEWFTTPMIDSYHTVWFELHEDLLLSQGIERREHT